MTSRKGPPFPVSHHAVLPNGLRVVGVELPHLAGGHAAVLVRTGPRHETPATHGLSHLCEHMLFRGCGRLPSSSAMAQAAEKFMGSLEGATFRDHAVYSTAFRPEGLAQAMGLLGHMMRSPRFDGVAVERAVVLEEISEAFDEKGQEIEIDNLSRGALFPKHPAGRSIDGTLPGVRGLGLRQLRAHHRQLYVARNMVVAVAGPVSWRNVLATAGRALGGLPAGAPAPLPGGVPVPARGPRLKVVSQPGPQTQLRLTFPCVAHHHPSAVALQLMRRVLDDGFTSRMQRELVDRRGLAYELWADVDLMEDHGTLEFGASVSHGKEAATVKAILGEARKLARRGPGPAELRRAVERLQWALTQMFDHAAGVTEWYGRSALFGLEARPQEVVRRARAVSATQLRDAARATLLPQHLLVTAVGDVPRAQQGAIRAHLRAQR
jgi:predicted Zn-dependent peptidase